MNMRFNNTICLIWCHILLLTGITGFVFAHNKKISTTGFQRQYDIIYGRKHGMALTLDAFTPKKTNGAGVIWIISGSGRSNHKMVDESDYLKLFKPLLKRGYTIFAVVHSSAPKFNFQDFVPDIQRAIRFVRSKADDFSIDGNKIAVAGISSGGHLALMAGVIGKEGDPNAIDPIERESSKIQAVGCFFPPSDWLNFGGEGVNVIDFLSKQYGKVNASFIFYSFNEEKDIYIIETDKKKILKLLGDYSPLMHVSGDDAPTLIIHGDSDTIVPFRQGKRMIEELQKVSVPSELVVKQNKGHGWENLEKDVVLIADWFDRFVKSEAR